MNGGIFSGSIFSGMGQVMQPVTALRPMELTPMPVAPPLTPDATNAAGASPLRWNSTVVLVSAAAVAGLGALGYFVWRRRQVKTNRSRRRR